MNEQMNEQLKKYIYIWDMLKQVNNCNRIELKWQETHSNRVNWRQQKKNSFKRPYTVWLWCWHTDRKYKFKNSHEKGISKLNTRIRIVPTLNCLFYSDIANVVFARVQTMIVLCASRVAATMTVTHLIKKNVTLKGITNWPNTMHFICHEDVLFKRIYIPPFIKSSKCCPFVQ